MLGIENLYLNMKMTTFINACFYADESVLLSLQCPEKQCSSRSGAL